MKTALYNSTFTTSKIYSALKILLERKLDNKTRALVLKGSNVIAPLLHLSINSFLQYFSIFGALLAPLLPPVPVRYWNAKKPLEMRQRRTGNSDSIEEKNLFCWPEISSLFSFLSSMSMSNERTFTCHNNASEFPKQNIETMQRASGFQITLNNVMGHHSAI